jgi:uncharacterized protein (DUF2141 family)
MLTASLGFWLLFGGPAQAQVSDVVAGPARLAVTIEGVRNEKGDVYVALFAKPDFFPDGSRADRELKRPASTTPMTFVFDNLAPGTYAVGTFHDENGNGKLDKNFIGFPVEGFGLSNNLRPRFAPPLFADAAFLMPAEGGAITIRIEY